MTARALPIGGCNIANCVDKAGDALIVGMILIDIPIANQCQINGLFC